MKLRPLDVTLLVTDGFFDQALAEVERNLGTNEQPYADSIRLVRLLVTMILIDPSPRVRILSLGEAHFSKLAELDKAFEKVWKGLIDGEEVMCKKTSAKLRPLPKPQAVIVDVRMLALAGVHLLKLGYL